MCLAKADEAQRGGVGQEQRIAIRHAALQQFGSGFGDFPGGVEQVRAEGGHHAEA